MMYSPRELADEIGVHIDQIYAVYIPLGCPHERDKQKHIAINGKVFAEWYYKVYPKIKLAHDEAFCLTCKMGVKIIKPKQITKNDITYLLSKCPNCGRKLPKKKKKKRRDDDF